MIVHPNGRIFFGEFLKDRVVGPGSGSEGGGARATADIAAQCRLNVLDIFPQFAALSIEDNLRQTLTGSTSATTTTTATAAANTGSKTAPSVVVQQPTLFNTTLSSTTAVLGSNELQTKVLQRTALQAGPAAAAAQTTARASVRCVEAVAALKAGPEVQATEIERLLLRYNTQLRAFYKKATESANRRKFGHKELLSITDRFSAQWSKPEQTMYLARDIFKRFSCLPFDQVRKLLREIDVIGPHFYSYDLLGCYRRMLQHHQ